MWHFAFANSQDVFWVTVMRAEARSDIDVWLAERGLEIYGAAFREHDILPSMIADLSGDELRELGVNSFDHRNRLQLASRALRAASSQAATQPAGPTAQWRPLSFLFVELIEVHPGGDAERRGENLQRFHELAAKAIQAHGGSLALVAGERIVACFGYPQAQGQDAERAVRAGLALMGGMSHLQRGQGGGDLRLAAATGLTIISDAVDASSLLHEGATGRIPNLAARLLDQAQTGSFLISAATHERIGDMFESVAVGPLILKGFAAAQPAWRILGETRGISRFEAMLRHQKPMPLVGRKPEASILSSLLAKARAGVGQTVLITGEPGTGKSSLVAQALLSRTQGDEFALVLQCAPHAASVAFYPLRTCLERLLQIESDQPDDLVQRRLVSFMRRVEVPGIDLPGAINQLLEITGPVASAAPRHGADETRILLITTMIRVFEALAARGAVILVEDAHWIDPSTSEVIAAMTRAAATLPVVMAITSQDAEIPSWLPALETRVLRLAPLYPDEISQLVQAVAAPHVLSAEQIDSLVARASGMPLYAEELTRGLIGQMARSEVGGLKDMQIPDSLQESLLARLNHLGAGRRIVSYAGVLGRQFPLKLLQMLVPGTQAASRDGIAELEEAGLLIRSRERFGEALEFRHALLRDAVVQMLLRQERIAVHAQAAQLIADSFPELAEKEPQFLAEHLLESGQIAAAMLHYDKAARVAFNRAAYREALAYYDLALEHNAHLPRDATTLRQEFRFRVGRTRPLIALHGYGASAVAQEITILAQLGKSLGSQRELFSLILTRCSSRTARGRELYALARQIAEVADPHDVGQQLTVLRVLGASLFYIGRIRESAAMIDAFFARSTVEQAYCQTAASLRTLNRLHLMGLRAVISVMLGQPAPARSLWQSCMASCDDSAQPHWRCMAYMHGCVMLELLDDEAGLAELTQRFDSLARSENITFWKAYASLFVAIVKMRSNQTAAGIELAGAAIAELQGKFHDNGPLIIAAALLIRHDALDRADVILRQIKPYLDAGECHIEAEYYRLQGLLALRRGAALEVVKAHFLHARDTAQRQGNVLFRKRAATDLRGLGVGAPHALRPSQAPPTGLAMSGSSNYQHVHRPVSDENAAEKL